MNRKFILHLRRFIFITPFISNILLGVLFLDHGTVERFWKFFNVREYVLNATLVSDSGYNRQKIGMIIYPLANYSFYTLDNSILDHEITENILKIREADILNCTKYKISKEQYEELKTYRKHISNISSKLLAANFIIIISTFIYWLGYIKNSYFLKSNIASINILIVVVFFHLDGLLFNSLKLYKLPVELLLIRTENLELFITEDRSPTLSCIILKTLIFAVISISSLFFNLISYYLCKKVDQKLNNEDYNELLFLCEPSSETENSQGENITTINV